MTTFGLVHGAFYGSWCWERLTLELERLGHRMLTVDLPSEEPQAGAAQAHTCGRCGAEEHTRHGSRFLAEVLAFGPELGVWHVIGGLPTD